ncbi:PREDICTED: uncharacterized protein LOC105955136 [Erythranthe guttata]|uniref:uncharacterized protein LOC105955136 n=1 Tax=Erythranthe guttata TaxID=4155 RepID=UPI00064DE467|nr:PREDICTED: uncharacterized protein LOC105955136 [Erythranthe guttata]|eukprot:XP_012834294.1 PREDICTED: uncharacterized protein LOC105955136 [Erythranthe guttata]
MTASFRALSSKFRPVYSSKGRWAGTVTPRKLANDNPSEARFAKEESEPKVAFARPPLLPPLLGPLVALSVMQSSTKWDNNDD